MWRVVGRRLLIAVPTMLVVCTFTFMLLQLVPGSPADFILGGKATSEQVEAINRSLGLDRPVLTQFFSWMGNLLTGNLGTSYTSGTPVTQALAVALQPTVSLAIGSTIVSIVIGLGLGMFAAVRGGKVDGAIQTVSSLLMAVPNFWLAAILVVVFALKIELFPATGYTDFGDSPGAWIAGLVLPVVAIAAAALAQLTLQARSSVLDVLSKDFIRTLQAAGVPRRRILFKHVLRNSAIPVTTVAGLNFVFTLSGVVVVETIFNMPGMGTLMLNAVTRHDLPVLQGAVIYFSLIVVVINLATDLLTAWLDPRVHVA
ncbi:MAG: ABC transporter permease [Nocardioides sp.]|uniref:ABC transporter permease n=1 Tax=Nocardioides sp. TaxID=35761 RepID=UPI0039E68EEB